MRLQALRVLFLLIITSIKFSAFYLLRSAYSPSRDEEFARRNVRPYTVSRKHDVAALFIDYTDLDGHLATCSFIVCVSAYGIHLCMDGTAVKYRVVMATDVLTVSARIEKVRLKHSFVYELSLLV